MDKPPPERSDAGKRIAMRRTYLGKTQESIEEETNGLLKQRMLSRVERGKKTVGSFSTAQTSALMRVLDWTPEEFEEETGVQLPERVPGAMPYAATLRIPVLGSVSAGVSPNEVGDADAYRYYDPSTEGLRGRRPDVLGEVIVNGDSMVSEGAAQEVKNGSQAVVEFGAIPEHGNLVVAWIDDLNVAVLKRYEEGPDAILRSLNPSGPVFRAGAHRIEVRGVVRYVGKKQ